MHEYWHRGKFISLHENVRAVFSANSFKTDVEGDIGYNSEDRTLKMFALDRVNQEKVRPIEQLSRVPQLQGALGPELCLLLGEWVYKVVGCKFDWQGEGFDAMLYMIKFRKLAGTINEEKNDDGDEPRELDIPKKASANSDGQ